MKTDRRQHRRFDTNPETVKTVIVSHRKQFSVRDISLGGMMVEYVPGTNERFDTLSIDVIATAHDQVYLRSISCRTVYDILALAENKAFSGETIRRRGLKFVGLTQNQIHTLKRIIDRLCTEAPAN
ncbi:hypothetical protein DSCO28_61830 [Desulfosarcina ovata subsp. sediminis]|uniref:PilZ domain-containing protein n=1 Tax=Desulfosarcina ovata subsp. sediminis TaxID=885957 RepID=A0A5K7ZZC7_9BACT|nr:hypothetical protein [Desulfosarcina ovata]BBO85617.1 hypothetical protein DSCO28_61830 [Desulfosarcina ovata subsp. sediminis]